MNHALERRVTALERFSQTGSAKTLILRFKAPGDLSKPLVQLTHQSSATQWNRLPQESVECFISRVKAEIPFHKGGFCLLVGN